MAKVIGIETRIIDGREFTVTRLDNPAAEKAAAKTDWSGYRPHNKKRDVTKGADTRTPGKLNETDRRIIAALRDLKGGA